MEAAKAAAIDAAVADASARVRMEVQRELGERYSREAVQHAAALRQVRVRLLPVVEVGTFAHFSLLCRWNPSETVCSSSWCKQRWTRPAPAPSWRMQSRLLSCSKALTKQPWYAPPLSHALCSYWLTCSCCRGGLGSQRLLEGARQECAELRARVTDRDAATEASGGVLSSFFGMFGRKPGE